MKVLALPARVLSLGTYVVVKPIEAVKAGGVHHSITLDERGSRAKEWS